MQSTTTKRFTPVPLAIVLIIAVAAGLAVGVIALGMTDNLPGQGGSASVVRQAPVVIAPSAGEGLVSPQHLESLLSPGATLDPAPPMVKGEPSYGQGEGLIGAGATLGTTRPMITGDPSYGQGEGFVGPGGTFSSDGTENVSDPFWGGLTER